MLGVQDLVEEDDLNSRLVGAIEPFMLQMYVHYSATERLSTWQVCDSFDETVFPHEIESDLRKVASILFHWNASPTLQS